MRHRGSGDGLLMAEVMKEFVRAQFQ